MAGQRALLLSRIGLSTVAVVALAGAFTMLFALFTAQMGTMFFALIAGAIGAVVSIIRRMPRLKDEDMESLVSSWWNLLVPLMAGSLMAGFIYMAFMAGILTGDSGGGLFTSNLFPTFVAPRAAPDSETALNLHMVLGIRPKTVQDFGKLVAWCFLSGYSERLVPSLLASLEQRGTGQDKDPAP